jgi:hypothetical protein
MHLCVEMCAGNPHQLPRPRSSWLRSKLTRITDDEIELCCLHFLQELVCRADDKVDLQLGMFASQLGQRGHQRSADNVFGDTDPTCSSHIVAISRCGNAIKDGENAFCHGNQCLPRGRNEDPDTGSLQEPLPEKRLQAAQLLT